ncbi:ESX secretion-associated protein EspG [Rhodococcus rhodnii]|uniref:ESX secretion-associated protein EspG n=1 Tax=Rhodococcus rhodnii TaxID=38312 RepID=UPI00147414A7|nr:ESX secretion-associated protein EspG [Rhodococcus rhodnii]
MTSEQFSALWSATGLDHVPHPLHYRGSAATLDDQQHIDRALNSWTTSHHDPALASAIDVLRHAELSVSLIASPTATTPELRRRAAIRGRHVVVVEQGDDAAGDVTVWAQSGRTDPDLSWLAGTLLHGLTNVPPGRTAEVTAHPDDLTATGAAGVLRSSYSRGAPVLAGIVARREAAGYVMLLGPFDGADEPCRDQFTWLDVAGDGRYLYVRDDLVRLTRADESTLRAELTTRCANALRGAAAPAEPRAAWQ